MKKNSRDKGEISTAKIAAFSTIAVAIITGLFALLQVWVKPSDKETRSLTSQVQSGLPDNVTPSTTEDLLYLMSPPIAIDSQKPWQSTGVIVKKGDTLNIVVVGGAWTAKRERLPNEIRNGLSADLAEKIADEVWMNLLPETAGIGSDVVCKTGDQCPITDYYMGALIARIGHTNYTVGNKCSFTATEAGEVFLQINDNYMEMDDNFGILAVKLRIGERYYALFTNCGTPSY